MTRVEVVFGCTSSPSLGKYKKVSKVTVTFGPLILAHATLPGDWNSKQAAAEYRKNPTKFTLTEAGERYKHLLN